jgi:hypothetical protein
MQEPVTLTGPQADLCRAVLCQELMKVSQLLARDQDGSGGPLDDEGRYGLTRYNMELQMTLLALGMTSAQLERTVKHLPYRSRATS